MIIAAFGDTWAGAYQFPTAAMADDYASERPAVARAVGQSAGALDLRGSAANAVRAQVVTKRFTSATAVRSVFSGTGLVSLSTGSDLVIGTSTAFLSQVTVGDVITADGHSYTVIAVTDNTHLTISPASLTTTAVRVSFTLTPQSPRWADGDTANNALIAATLALGESKLWALMRDGTHRWTWAKCVRVDAAERYDAPNHLPTSLRFWCRTGLWYSETQHSLTTDGDDVLANAGNAVAHMTATVSCASTGTLSITLQNVVSLYFQTAWSGAATAGQSLVIDSGACSVKLNGVGVYSGLTRTYSNEWLGLKPGNNQIRITTGARYGAVVYTWHDTWLM